MFYFKRQIVHFYTIIQLELNINIFNREDGKVNSTENSKYCYLTKNKPTATLSHWKSPNWQSYSLWKKRTLDLKGKAEVYFLFTIFQGKIYNKKQQKILQDF